MASGREDGIGVIAMAISEKQLQSLVNHAEERERTARRRAIVYSLIPILLAGLLLVFTAWQLGQMNRRLSVVNTALQVTERNLASVELDLATAQEQVKQSQQELEDSNQALDKAQRDLEVANIELEQRQREVATVLTELEETQQELGIAKAQLEETQREVDELRTRLEEANIALDQVTEQLAQATDFQRHLSPANMLLVLKGLPDSQQFGVLMSIVDMQGRVGWKWGGIAPEEGFDSPSFAAFVLERNGLLPAPAFEVRYRLREVLRATSSPNVGDVVFYERGYTMFYYVDQDNQPFVIGMTPFGILALEPDFAPIIGFGTTG